MHVERERHRMGAALWSLWRAQRTSALLWRLHLHTAPTHAAAAADASCDTSHPQPWRRHFHGDRSGARNVASEENPAVGIIHGVLDRVRGGTQAGAEKAAKGARIAGAVQLRCNALFKVLGSDEGRHADRGGEGGKGRARR